MTLKPPARYAPRIGWTNVVLWVALAAAVPSRAAETPDETQDPVSRLRTIEGQINKSRTRADTLETEARELAEESARLSKRLVTIAARVQAREAEISTTEKRLSGLGNDERKLRVRLVKRRAVLAELLAGLQRLEQNPPPALAVRPEDALGAVRSAMLLGVVVPELRVEANALSQDISRLKRLRASIEREQAFLSENLASLELERGEVRELIETKRATSKLTAEEIKASQTRMEKLAREAKSFRDLIARLDEDKRKSAEQPQSEARRVVARATALVKPSIAFSKAKRSLAFPAQGVKIREFGVDDGVGGTAKGLSIATRQDSQITTPCDGWVVYAGEFRSYGKLLIINAGEGYHVLLAGMERINVDTGQFVRSGEPVGTMGKTAVGSAAIGGLADTAMPILYVEFRKGGSSIDPGPWWAGGDEKVRG